MGQLRFPMNGARMIGLRRGLSRVAMLLSTGAECRTADHASAATGKVAVIGDTFD